MAPGFRSDSTSDNVNLRLVGQQGASRQFFFTNSLASRFAAFEAC
jgi:hypothetical protein